MKVVIDLQAFQTEGIGEAERSALALATTALLADAADHDVHLLVDGRRLEGAADLLQGCALGRVSPANIHRWYAPDSGPPGSRWAAWRHQVAETIRNAAIARLRPDCVVLPLVSPASAPQSFSRERTGQIAPLLALLAPAPTDGGVRLPRLVPLGGAGGRLPEKRDIVPSLLSGAEWARPLSALEGKLVAGNASPGPAGRPRLAFVSPLPPERSGISFYSRELLPALSAHYDIELVVQQPRKVDREIARQFVLRGVEWFDRNAGDYDRIVYQFGNSTFHQHMFGLLRRHPGVVVLHDVFLSGIAAHMERSGHTPGFWVRSLYESHGYKAVRERYREPDSLDVIWRYPCSFGVVEQADGVIVHSETARHLIAHWHGSKAAEKVSVVPHLREPAPQRDRDRVRTALGLSDEDFLVCSFGGIGPTKLSHRLFDAWQKSGLADDPRCRLVLVGTGVGDYGRRLAERVKREARNVELTGWAEEAIYQRHLEAADLAVQLRTFSRGESSGAVLDCMSAGVPLVVNAHGTMAELAPGTVRSLADGFSDEELAHALEELRERPDIRQELAGRARERVLSSHDPANVGRLYQAAIEASFRGASRLERQLPDVLAAEIPAGAPRGTVETVASCLALSLPPAAPAAQLLFDVTAILRHDLKTGVERTVRSLLSELLRRPPAGFRIEPVYASAKGFQYARRFTCEFMDVPGKWLADAPVEMLPGDLYFMADLDHASVVKRRPLYRAMRRHGVTTAFMIHDLLPIRLPDCFPAHAPAAHAEWLRVVAEADRAVCVSRSVAEDFSAWLDEEGYGADDRPGIFFSHHGADLAASRPTRGVPRRAERTLTRFRFAPTFLMVGTVEPRKGHDEVLSAFERLWAEGGKETLVIAGKPGWMVKPILRRLDRHPENGKRLFWLKDASDEFLDRLYESCTCLIAASRGEGFGLPLVEAARKGLPVLARDIPVFREVAGDNAEFFGDARPESLAHAIRAWLRKPRVRSRTAPPALTWSESAGNLTSILTGTMPHGAEFGSWGHYLPGCDVPGSSGIEKFAEEPAFRDTASDRQLRVDLEAGSSHPPVVLREESLGA